MEPKYISVKLTGGLGNQLFIWATAIAISKKRDLKLKFDASDCTQYGCELERIGIFLDPKPSVPADGVLLTRFPDKANIFIGFLRSVRIQIRYLRFGSNFWERPGGFDKTVFDIKAGKNLRGYFQSYKYFQNLQPEIQAILNNRKDESIEFSTLSKSLSSSPWVAIHVRRQDYEIMRDSFGLIGENYYQRAIKHLETVFPNLKSYVFSDDIGQAKLLVPGCNGYISKAELASALDTLVLMSQANAIIGSNSSFSWWAAFLMKSEDSFKYFPEPWFNDTKLNTSDLVPASWSRISSSFA